MPMFMTAEKIQIATDLLAKALQEASNKTVSFKDADNAMDRKCTKKHIQTLHENLDKVNQQLAEVKEQLAEAKEQVTISKKEQALLFAFENASFGAFRYNEGRRTKDTTNLVKKAILCFRRDIGFKLPTKATLVNDRPPRREEKFRDAFVKQLAYLIGKEPRISLHSDGSFHCICYE